MKLGGNIPLDFLLTKFPDNRAWTIAKDLKFTAIRPLGGKSGNVAHINLSTDTNWAQNLKALLEEAEAQGLEIAFHELGNPWGTLLGILAPYYNYQPVGNLGATPTPLIEALDMIDKLGGNNELAYNFLQDPRVPYWQVINEAPISNQAVRNWTGPVADRIRSHGGKTVGTLKGDSTPYADFRPIMPFAEKHFDWIQAHDYFYFPETLNLLEAEGATAEIYQTVYNKAVERIGLMLSTRGDFPVDRVINGEWGMMHGSFKPPGINKAYQVTHKQRADYIKAVFDAMKDIGLVNHYYHLIFDDSTETWGVVDENGSPYPEEYNNFKAGMSLTARARGVKVDLVNRTVTNTGDVEITLKELIMKITKIGPGDTVSLDPDTKTIEI